MAKVLFLSVLLSILLSFHVASGDSGWVIPSHGMDHVCRLTEDRVAADICRVLLKVTFGRLIFDFPRIKISECSLVSIKIVPKPKIGLHIFVCVDIFVDLGPLLYLRLELTVRVVLHIGRHGLFVYACTGVDTVVKGRSLLITDLFLHVGLDGLVRALIGPMCERGRVWCKDLNYCFDFMPHPFPITPSCYGLWRNQPPRITENQMELRSQPVCTCREMEEGVSVTIDSIVALRATLSLTDQSVYFCHEKDTTYIFECMRKGGSFNDLFVSVSLSIGRIVERLPSIIFLCPRTAHIVIKVECTRIYVDMQAGHALLCLRLRVRIGCDLSNFTSSLDFIVTGCLNLSLDVDCRRELLLLSVSARTPLRIRSTCTEGEECESDEGLLTELFLTPLTAWCVNHINAKIKGGLRMPFLRHYPCDKCERSIYSRRRVYCPCTLRYVS